MQNEGSGSLIGLVIPLLVLAFIIVSMWKVFAKAGQPGWASLIPIYNVYVLCKIAGKPGWWVLLMFIPVVNLIIALLVALGVAQNFGRSPAFGIGVFFLPIVFYPILAFGNASYRGSSAAPPVLA